MADKKNLPTTDALKERFKAGSIPLQSDFADLIDMADVGASAAGVAANQDGKPGVGLKLSTDGKLQLNVGTYTFNSDNNKTGYAEIMVDSSNNKPLVDLGDGLLGGQTLGLTVKASTGIVVNGNGVSVDEKVIANADAGAKAVGKYTGQDGKPGLGMRLTSDGKLEPDIDSHDYSLATDTQGVSPITVDTSSNKLVVDINVGLQAGASGLSVKPSTGIKVDANGVSVDMAYVVPRGVIVMFSGSAAPTGWAFCDGNNDTPDLRDRFIKGSNNFDKSSGGNKTNTYRPTGTVTINSHTLTVNEIPSHKHTLGIEPIDTGGWYFPKLDSMKVGHNTSQDSTYAIQNTGGGQGHSHTGSFQGNDWNQNNEPQYFAIAFIMKL